MRCVFRIQVNTFTQFQSIYNWKIVYTIQGIGKIMQSYSWGLEKIETIQGNWFKLVLEEWRELKRIENKVN